MALEIKNGKKAIGLSLTVLLGATLLYLIFVPRPVKMEIAVASKGSFQETIQADGILRSRERYTVPAFADGDIKRVSLKVGDPVKKGETITELFWDVKYDPLKAPISGVISKVYRESAGPIRRGEPIVEIVDPSQLELMVELLTTDAVRLQEGSPVTIENWAGGAPIQTKVSRISKAGYTKQSALGVEEERTEVTADLTNLPKETLAKVGSNFHVDVTFQVSETKNALKIPVGAIFRDGQNWAVYVVDKGRARKKGIAVSALNPKEASIRSGISPGDRVIVYPGDLVKEGTRVNGD